MVEEIVRIITTRHAMSQVNEAYEESKLEKLRIQRQIFLNFKFSIVWKRRAKKWGGGLWDIHRGRLKRVFTLQHQALGPGRQAEATAVLYPFLKANADHEKTRVRVRYFFERIVFMQRRIHDKLVCIHSKVDVLVNYWEKMEFQILAGAAPNAAKGRPMDQEAQAFAMKLHRVPAEVRRACLSAYVQCCRRLHAICFLQWRQMYPGLKYDEAQVDVLISKGLRAVQDEIVPNQKVKEEHVEEQELPYPEFKKRYKMVDRRKLVFLINDFAQIGWCDPFPLEAVEVEAQASVATAEGEEEIVPSSLKAGGVRVPYSPLDRVYPETRMIDGFSPTVIYIPSREIMFKMMRACIGVTDPKDLWIFNSSSE